MKFNCTEDKLRELLESASLSDNNSTFKDASTAISSGKYIKAWYFQFI